jgi:tetratricopeptide (TPR) repeat protein
MGPRAEKDDNITHDSAPPNTEFIERCQIEYERNPSSRVFAPLAEGYRRLKLLDEAFDVASRGVRQHPDFATGRLAFARILIEKEAYADAVDQLRKATELSPDNILAFLLLGETWLKLRRPKEALDAFKMVLFLNPLHERASKMVKKWEFLTADEFEDEIFEWSNIDLSDNSYAAARAAPPAMTSVSGRSSSQTLEQPSAPPKKPTHADREANRAISIADALTVRNDIEGAFTHISRAVRMLGPREDLQHRLFLLGKRMGLRPEEALTMAGAPRQNEPADEPVSLPTESPPHEAKRKKLQNLLKKVQRKNGDN